MDLLALFYNYNQLRQLTTNGYLRLAPLITGIRVSSLLLWLTWFWFTNPSLVLLRLPCECLQLNSKVKGQSHIATDGRSISKSWCRAPCGAHDQICITLWQLRSCFCGAPCLTIERVCLLYMLPVLASVVFLGYESLGTRDHILLSQIWDFPFRRLLRLAGISWGYSTPPPHGCWSQSHVTTDGSVGQSVLE
jgi:hypothetical protein